MNQLAKTQLEAVTRLDNYLQQFPQVILPLEHQFVDKQYCRTIFMPSGTIVTGQIHNEDSFLWVRYGDFEVTTDEGVQRLYTGDMVKTLAGTKRALYMYADTCLTSVFNNPDNERDIEKLWTRLFYQPKDTSYTDMVWAPLFNYLRSDT
jgi:hypothetical protein